MRVEAEVSLYPLGEERLSPFITSFVNVLKEHGCEAEVGQMSTGVFHDGLEQIACPTRARCEAPHRRVNQSSGEA